jgi:hypothetical protein
MTNRIPKRLNINALHKNKDQSNSIYNQLLPECSPEEPFFRSCGAEELEHHYANCHSAECWGHDTWMGDILEFIFILYARIGQRRKSTKWLTGEIELQCLNPLMCVEVEEMSAESVVVLDCKHCNQAGPKGLPLMNL